MIWTTHTTNTYQLVSTLTTLDVQLKTLLLSFILYVRLQSHFFESAVNISILLDFISLLICIVLYRAPAGGLQM